MADYDKLIYLSIACQKQADRQTDRQTKKTRREEGGGGGGRGGGGIKNLSF